MNKVPQPVLAWLLPLSAVFLFGPLAAMPLAALRSEAGTTDTTFLVGPGLLSGLFALIWATTVTAVAAGIATLLAGHTVARHTAGFVLVWVVLRTGDTRLILMETGGSAIVPLLLEGVLMLAAGLILLTAIGSRDPGVAGTVTGFRDALTRRAGLITLAVATVAALAGAYVVALTGLPGQGAFAGFMAGTLAGAVGRLVGQTLGDKDPDVPSAIAPLLAAVIAPATLLVMTGGGPLDAAARTGAISGLGLIQPAAWLIAAVAGVPVGASWAASSAERTEHRVGAKAA